MNPFFNISNIFKTIIMLILLATTSYYAFSQKKVDDDIEEFYKEKVAITMDTSYINYEVGTWSIRAFSIIKDHSFQLRNSDIKFNYTPNNRFGVGFGVAYYPVLLDIGFNIKPRQKEPTKRFDMQAKVLLRDHYFGLVVQDYKGFNISSSEMNDKIFREDIRSSAINLTYGYVFNSKRASAGSIFSGFHVQKRNVGSFILGGFFSYYRMRADSSIVPVEQQNLFNGSSGINGAKNIGGGIIGGYGHIFVFPHNLFLFINILPGIGLIKKNITTESSSYQPSDPLLYRLNFNLSFGYNGPKFYIIITGGDDISITSLDFGNWGALNIGKAKLIFGYKFRKQ